MCIGEVSGTEAGLREHRAGEPRHRPVGVPQVQGRGVPGEQGVHQRATGRATVELGQDDGGHDNVTPQPKGGPQRVPNLTTAAMVAAEQRVDRPGRVLRAYGNGERAGHPMDARPVRRFRDQPDRCGQAARSAA
nr:hypothetical protein [Frankia sp. EI5c]